MIKKYGIPPMVFSIVSMALLLWDVDLSFAQYGGRYNSGGGYNSGYGGSNSGYGGYNSGGYGSSYGSSMMGQGGSRYSSMGGSRGSSRMSSRGGYNTGGNNSGGYNSGAYGMQGGGYDTNSRSRRATSRSSRSNANYNQGSGYLPQSAPGTTEAPGQTAPMGSSATRSRALSGQASTGAAPAAQGGDAAQGGVRVMGKPQFGAQAGPAGQPAAGQGKKAAEPKVTAKPTANFFLNSFSSVGVINEPLTVDLILSNTNKIGFDRFNIALKYDPQVLQPITGELDENGEYVTAAQMVTAAKSEEGAVPTPSTNESSIKSFLLSGKQKFEIIRNEIHAREGRIVMAARLNNETATDSGIVGQIQFLPLKEARSTSIRFDFSEPEEEGALAATDLTLAGADQLGSKFDPKDGVVNIDFEIVSSLEKAKKRPVVETQRDRFDEESEEGSLGTRLSLIPRDTDLDVGDTVEIDVYLDNPNREAIDSVSLLIAYNPRIFEPVDADDYAAGINLDDKDYYEEFPFDFPLINSIDEERGLIDYRKRVNRAPVKGEGILATIRLRAIRPTTKTTLRIFLNESGEEPTTGIFYRNRDCLGDPSDRFDGVRSTSLTVRPTTAYLRRNQTVSEKG